MEKGKDLLDESWIGSERNDFWIEFSRSKQPDDTFDFSALM